MKKLFIVSVLLCEVLFADIYRLEQIKNKIESDWQLNPYSTDWARKITQPKECNGGWDNKVLDVITISTNIMKEKPDVWLQGKYLEFINSKCSLTSIYTLRNTTKSDFDKLVNRDNNMITKNNNSNSYLGGLLAGIIFVFGIFSLIRRFLWGAN